MATLREDELIYDWNLRGDIHTPPLRRVEYVDETLRDGIQCPSVTDPPIEAKLEVIRLLSGLGVNHVDIGLPGAGQRAIDDCIVLAEMARDEKLSINLQCAARTHPNDIRPIIEISQKVGVPIEVMAFLGASPIRLYTEGWDADLLEQRTRTAVKMAKDAGLPCTFVTEDTVRSNPKLLARLFHAALEEGADGLCLCDTCGHATHNGVFNLVHFTRNMMRAEGFEDRRIDWHGHNDRGHALSNALIAIEAGADRVHGTVLGVGERVGNTSIDQLLVNLKLLGVHEGDLSQMAELVALVSEACEVPIPVSYPVFGRDAFRTGTGVHAAAVVKAMKRGDDWLADRIYSGVPAGWFGLKQVIEVGHYSGMSNVHAWLVSHGYEATEALSKKIFDFAKSTNRVLEDDEIVALIES
ncbi:MAG: 2-isopropylmalate synthase [Proteobacteria bacterium]|nr:2-isopropylmalate synthase [Pseudomonadota bacterium]MCP4918968.1 2-isopropylmalate synthase [Pseudomonadota bacterium]